MSKPAESDPIDQRIITADAGAMTDRMGGLIDLLDDVAQPYREIQAQPERGGHVVSTPGANDWRVPLAEDATYPRCVASDDRDFWLLILIFGAVAFVGSAAWAVVTAFVGLSH